MSNYFEEEMYTLKLDLTEYEHDVLRQTLLYNRENTNGMFANTCGAILDKIDGYDQAVAEVKKHG